MNLKISESPLRACERVRADTYCCPASGGCGATSGDWQSLEGPGGAESLLSSKKRPPRVDAASLTSSTMSNSSGGGGNRRSSSRRRRLLAIHHVQELSVVFSRDARTRSPRWTDTHGPNCLRASGAHQHFSVADQACMHCATPPQHPPLPPTSLGCARRQPALTEPDRSGLGSR